MRIVIIVGSVIIMTTIAVLFIISGQNSSVETSRLETINKERIDVLEQSLQDMQQQNQDWLNPTVEAMEQRIAMLGEQVEKLAAEKGKPDEAEPNRDSGKAPIRPEDDFGFKELFREELRQMEKEKEEKRQENLQAREVQEWERAEFGKLARYMHDLGCELGLTDNQKREYYRIVEEHGKKKKGLWEEAQRETSDFNELRRICSERGRVILKSERECIMNILNDEQREKYQKKYPDYTESPQTPGSGAKLKQPRQQK